MIIDAKDRRDSLLEWLRAELQWGEMTAQEIVDVIGYPYNEVGHYRVSRCFDDLAWLERAGLVYRAPTRPARWGLA